MQWGTQMESLCVFFYRRGGKIWQLLIEFLSGIPEMDQALDNIRLGDNVVWRVSHLEEFRYFCEPYVEQAIKDKRNIVYFRFAKP